MSHFQRPSRFAAACTLALLGALPGMAQACDIEPTIGDVCTFAFDWCPDGFVPADGRLLPINGYQALFSLTGFLYGGDNRTTFGVPDLRGRSAIGLGQGPNMAGILLNMPAGQQQTTLTNLQVPLPAHSHPALFTPKTGSVSITFPATPSSLEITAALPLALQAAGGATPPATGNAYLTTVGASTGSAPVTLTGPYSTTVPGATSATIPARMGKQGMAGTPAVPGTGSFVTGATVSLDSNPTVVATAPVVTRGPALGMTMCIVTRGLYPDRP